MPLFSSFIQTLDDHFMVHFVIGKYFELKRYQLTIDEEKGNTFGGGGVFMNDGRSCLHHRHRSLAIGLSCKRFNYYYEMCYTYMLGLESFPHFATVTYMNRLVYSIISISNAILHGIYPLTSSHYERVQCFDWREAIVLHCSHQSILFIGHPKRLGSSCCCQSTSESSIRCQFELIEFVSN